MGPLGSEPRWLARTASVLGARISVAELAAVAGTTSAALLPALEELIGVGVLEEQGTGLAFRHDLTRSALYESLPAAVRAGVHRDIARVLIERGAAAVEVAHHVVEGAEAGDATSVAWLRRAAEEASVQAPGVGADLLERAAALVDTRSPRATRSPPTGPGCWPGRDSWSQAEALARELLDTGLPDAGAQSRLLATLGESLFFQGRVGEAGTSLQAAAERAAPERSLRVAEAALAVALGGQIDDAEVLALRAEAEGTDAGDVAAVALGLAVRSQLVGLRANHAEAAGLARRSLEVADGDPTRSHRYGPSLFLGSTLVEMDDDDAERVLRRGLALDAAQGTGWGAPVYHFFLGAHHLNRGPTRAPSPSSRPVSASPPTPACG